jgi:WD40 repeat protein
VAGGGITWEIMKQNSLASSHPRVHLPAPILLGPPTLIYRGHRDVLRAVAWSPDGTRIASGSYDKTVQVWNAITGDNVHIYRGHSDRVQAIAWSPDSQFIASASSDMTVQVWRAN